MNDNVKRHRRAVFFDRDGVINQVVMRHGRAYAPTVPGEFMIIQGVAEAIAHVQSLGLLTIVVTNQPEISSGRISWDLLESFHDHIKETTNVDAIYVCPHNSSEGCGCHKPKPGMLNRAASDWNIELTKSFLIGDRWRDVGAGLSVGCYTVLVERPYSGECVPDYRVKDISEAVQHITGSLVSQKN